MTTALDDRPRAPVGRALPIVPDDGRSTRSLVALVAALAFLAAFAAGAGALLAARSAGWSAAVSRAATIQLRPVAGRDAEADLERVARLARGWPGIAAARILDRRAADALLEPWLGRGLDLADLPVPRLVGLDLEPGARTDLAGLGVRLSGEVPGATLDDHAGPLRRLALAARVAIGLAVTAVGVAAAAAAAAIGFAVRAAVVTHRDVVEVLHYVGAGDRAIGRLFAGRFGRLGLGGGLIGAVLAAAALAAGAAALPGALATNWDDPWDLAAPALACLAVAAAFGPVSALVAARSVSRVIRATTRG